MARRAEFEKSGFFMFKSISLKNFRGFENLALDGLQRVNLVVGKNNAGKTSLLEAVALLSDLKMLNQLPLSFRTSHGSFAKRFYPWLIRDAAKPDYAKLENKAPNASFDIILSSNPMVFPSSAEVVGQGFYAWRQGKEETLRCRVISAQSRNPGELVKTFSRAVRQRDGERQLEELLRSVDPRVRKARVDAADEENVIVVDLGLSQLVPLTQTGEGMVRLVSIFADLIGDRPQICLIDEVENGIHHTVLPQVWMGIAEAATQLDIQIFATTHSFECLEAAHEAFAKREAYDLSVVQLFRLKDETDGRVLHRDLIEAAIEGNIDLR
jgi:predicted ATPase